MNLSDDGLIISAEDLARIQAQCRERAAELDAPFGTITEEFYDSIFNTNVKGLLFTVQKALSLMPDGASIILNASIVASKGLSALSVYSGTPGGSPSPGLTPVKEGRDSLLGTPGERQDAVPKIWKHLLTRPLASGSDPTVLTKRVINR